jgi:arylsulfatase A-like enzyme
MTRKSILLVTVDCLRADHTGFMGYPRPTTPFLDSLAGESFVFPAAIVAGAPTYYSLPAILASRYPLSLGRDVLGLAPDEPSLASVLKEAGYATAAFSAANPYISRRFGYEQGFDTFQDFLDAELPTGNLSDAGGAADANNNLPTGGWPGRLNRALQKIRPALGPLGLVYDELYFRYCQHVTPTAQSLDALRRFPAADVIVDSACRWLESIGEAPFFLWLHLMDPHSPYYPTADALSAMSSAVTPAQARYINSYWNRSDLGSWRLERQREQIVGLYDAAVRWVDTQLDRLVKAMRNSRQWDDCVMAVTADHGEEFLEHGGRHHPPSRLMEELIHVPLLLRVPGARKKQLTRSPFSLLHLAPTLLDAASQSAPAEFQAKSLWPQIRDGGAFDAFAISECVAGCTNPFRKQSRLGPRILSVRSYRYKLVLRFNPASDDLYDLETDPGEQVPLAPTVQKPMRKRLLEVAREHLQRSACERNSQARIRSRLRELRLDGGWLDESGFDGPRPNEPGPSAERALA